MRGCARQTAVNKVSMYSMLFRMSHACRTSEIDYRYPACNSVYNLDSNNATSRYMPLHRVLR